MRQCFALATFVLLAACGKEPAPDASAATLDTRAADARADAIRAATKTVAADRMQAADKEPGNWLAHGRTYSEQRHSPLADINAANVGGLKLAWYWDTGDKRGLEATPIVVDGVMFTTGTWSRVYANDAGSGELIWQYDPQVPKQWGRNACCDVVNRGVAVWKGRVFVGTLDGRLVALDAGNGEVVWETLTIDPERPYTITGAPRVVKDMVVIGNGGAEYGVRGYVTAYDWRTGEQKWRFHTVPGDPDKGFENPAMKMAAETWNGAWWTVGGGGTVWDSMAFDPALNLLYIGVGNGSPWNRDVRSPGGGDNLFLASIVALNADDGSYVWHYQTTPGETWDYTATQHMILADLNIGGAPRKVIMQAPKNGFFYVLDRATGEFLSAEPFVPVNWATHIDPKTARPVEGAGVRYAKETALIYPSADGGHNWHPMAYNPSTGLVYIPAMRNALPYKQEPDFAYKPGDFNWGIDFAAFTPSRQPAERLAPMQGAVGHLAAWDPVRQKEVWRVQHERTWNGGVLSTAGNLVFQGRSDGVFAAYAADTGALRWEMPVHTGIIAAPMSYTVDGEQYIAVMAGWGGSFSLFSGVPRHKGNLLSAGRILAFKLNGKGELPVPEVTHVNIPQPPEVEATEEEIARGETLYQAHCSRCHGSAVMSAGAVPDLKYLPAASHGRWDLIVRQGVYATVGMPGFPDFSAADAKAVHAYVVEQTRAAIALCESEYPKQFPELLATACTKRIVVNDAGAPPAGG